MTRIELKKARLLLLLTTSEAAKELSNTPRDARAWQRWESGDRSIPNDVSENIIRLIKKREAMINSKETYDFFESIEDFKLCKNAFYMDNIILSFKLNQSVSITQYDF